MPFVQRNIGVMNDLALNIDDNPSSGYLHGQTMSMTIHSTEPTLGNLDLNNNNCGGLPCHYQVHQRPQKICHLHQGSESRKCELE
jgi:hypothetical protein